MTCKSSLSLFLALLLPLSLVSLASAEKLIFSVGENNRVSAEPYTEDICAGGAGYGAGTLDFGLCNIKYIQILSADDLHCALTVDGNPVGDCHVSPTEMWDEQWRRIKRYSWNYLPGVVTSTMRLVCTKK